MTLHHDVPNSHFQVPGFNFLESLVNVLSAVSHSESAY